MKINCRCGAIIFDGTDDLPHKGHLIPDQDWFATFNAIDDEVIDPLAERRLDKSTAYTHALHLISRSARLVWQCRACGRLYMDDAVGDLHCFVPEGEPIDPEILRSRPSPA